MNIIQIVSRVLLFGVVLPLCLVFYITLCDGFCPGFRFEISSYITDKKLQRLYIGMANKEVLQIVGAPFLRVDASYYDCDYYWQYTKNFMETGVVVR